MAYDEVTEYANNKKIPDILRPQLFHQCCGHTMHSDSCIDDTVLERNEICADDSKIIAEIYTDDSNAEKFITGEEQNEIDARLQVFVKTCRSINLTLFRTIHLRHSLLRKML